MKVSTRWSGLPAKLGRSPRPRDVAEALGVSVEEVLEAMEAATAYEATSLDAPRPGDDKMTAGRSRSRSRATSELQSSSTSTRRLATPLEPCPSETELSCGCASSTT